MTKPTDEVLMPIGTSEALNLAEIHAMRGLTDAVASLTRHVERIGSKVDDVRERVIKLEEQRHGRDINDLKRELSDAFKRINELESERDQRRGALGLVGWARQTTPWIVAIFMAALAAIGWKPQGG